MLCMCNVCCVVLVFVFAYSRGQAVVDEYLGTLMGEIDTFDERQEAFRQRRADRKEVKQYLRGGPQADEDDSACAFVS